MLQTATPDLSPIFDEEEGDELWDAEDVEGQWLYSCKLHGEKAALDMWPERRLALAEEAVFDMFPERRLALAEDNEKGALTRKIDALDRAAEQREMQGGAILDRFGSVVVTAQQMREERARHNQRFSSLHEAEQSWPERFVELRRIKTRPDLMIDEDRAHLRQKREREEEEAKLEKARSEGRSEMLSVALAVFLVLMIILAIWRGLSG